MKKALSLIVLLLLINSNFINYSQAEAAEVDPRNIKITKNISRAYLWEIKTGKIYIRPFPEKNQDLNALPGWAAFGLMSW